jgi:hypothetical protein
VCGKNGRFDDVWPLDNCTKEENVSGWIRAVAASNIKLIAFVMIDFNEFDEPVH